MPRLQTLPNSSYQWLLIVISGYCIIFIIQTESCVQLQNAFDQQTVILQSAYREIEDLQEQVNNLHELLVPGGGNGTMTGNRRNKINKKRLIIICQPN